MKKIVFITPEDAEYGFSLAGVIQYSIKDRDFEETIKKVMADPETGLIAIDERLVNTFRHERLKRLEERFSGVVVIIPAPEKPEEVEDYLQRIIRRAIGYHVRLRI
jgi:V/A-type H+-transporting ATPase subunit F